MDNHKAYFVANEQNWIELKVNHLKIRDFKCMVVTITFSWQPFYSVETHRLPLWVHSCILLGCITRDNGTTDLEGTIISQMHYDSTYPIWLFSTIESIIVFKWVISMNSGLILL